MYTYLRNGEEMKKVNIEDIIEINELYLKLKVKAEVARRTGFSASTVSKYIIKDYKSKEEKEKEEKFNLPIMDLNFKDFCIPDWSVLCNLSEEEKEELKEFGKEVMI